MNNVITLLRQLESYVQEEIGAQGRLLASLEAQDRALRAHDAARIAEATRALDGEIEASSKRAQRRQELVSSLAKLWSVAPSSLTLGSIAERVGDEGARLGRQRNELQSASAQVAKLGRRNGLVARFHQRLTAEVLQAVLVQADGAPLHEGGALVDAEV